MKKSSSPRVLPLTFGLWCIGVIPPQRSCHRRGFIINPSKLAGPSFLCFHHHVATPVEQLRFSRCAHPRWYPMKFCQGSMIPVFLMDRWRWKRLSHATRIYIDALFFFPEILSGSRKGVRGWRRYDDGWISGESLLFPITRKHTRARDSSGRFSHDGSEC